MTAVMPDPVIESAGNDDVRRQLEVELGKILIDRRECIRFDELFLLMVRGVTNDDRLKESLDRIRISILQVSGAIDTLENPEILDGHTSRVLELAHLRKRAEELMQSWRGAVYEMVLDLSRQNALVLTPPAGGRVHVTQDGEILVAPGRKFMAWFSDD